MGEETSSSSVETEEGSIATTKTNYYHYYLRALTALLTTGAKDVAGNRLDQNPKQPKTQPMEWYFTTGTS